MFKPSVSRMSLFHYLFYLLSTWRTAYFSKQITPFEYFPSFTTITKHFSRHLLRNHSQHHSIQLFRNCYHHVLLCHRIINTTFRYQNIDFILFIAVIPSRLLTARLDSSHNQRWFIKKSRCANALIPCWRTRTKFL